MVIHKELSVKPVKIESPRLQLRSTVSGDAELLFKHYFSSVESSKFLSRLPHGSIEQTKQFLQKWTVAAWSEAGAPFAWVISKVDSAEPVGVFLVFPKNHLAEIHYGISELHRGQGFATEACELATHWLLEQSTVQSITTAVDLEHTATQRVLEKAGFKRDSVLKNHSVLPAFGSAARDAVSYTKSKY
ncbi:GNAT family N-acetyltransferase [Bdellovibrio sp. HCB288]|uniref:GNAT family N-acetyltransferase n=1 Tax=Bdellovibrio sp. HCB288 TaxID=3394355 RepID=UPI0039B366AD